MDNQDNTFTKVVIDKNGKIKMYLVDETVNIPSFDFKPLLNLPMDISIFEKNTKS